MKHLQSYNNFNKVNEELTSSEKRSIRFIPQAILGFLGKKILGIYPMLNLRWREMKRATTGLKDSPFITGTSYHQLMKHELIKMSIDDLPENKLKLAMFLRDWNIFLAKDYKSTGGGKVERDVIYISKDEIKKGDTYRGYRLNDSDIYPNESFLKNKLKDPANFPIVLMVAKYDQVEKVKEIKQLVDDICLEIEDELPVVVKKYFSLEQDDLSLDIYPVDRPLIYSSDVNYLINDVAERIKDYLKIEKLNFNYVIKYRVEGPLFYNGNAGRFGTEIIPAAQKYSAINDESEPIWNRHYKTLNIGSMCSMWSDDFCLTSDDIKTLLSDLGNCTKEISLNRDLETLDITSVFDGPELIERIKKNKITEIQLKQILVQFKKV